jgi:hypothetical protein
VVSGLYFDSHSSLATLSESLVLVQDLQVPRGYIAHILHKVDHKKACFLGRFMLALRLKRRFQSPDAIANVVSIEWVLLLKNAETILNRSILPISSGQTHFNFSTSEGQLLVVPGGNSS